MGRWKCKDGKCGQWLQTGDWPLCPHGALRSAAAQHFDPVVVFRDKKGHTIMPGRATDKPLPGYRRVELRTITEVRKFEREMTAELRNMHAESQLREEFRDKVYRQDRIDSLRSRISGLTGFERAAAERIIEKHANRSYSVAAQRYDPGFRVDVFTTDSSNRVPWSDVDSVGKANRR